MTMAGCGRFHVRRVRVSPASSPIEEASHLRVTVPSLFCVACCPAPRSAVPSAML